MITPLYLSLIRHDDGHASINSYTSLDTMMHDTRGKRIVTSWCKRDSLREAINTGRDWPINLTDDERVRLLAQLDRLIAINS